MKLGTTNRRLDAKAITQGIEVECPMRPGFFVTILPGAMYNPRYRKAVQEDADRVAEMAPSDAEVVNRYDSLDFVVRALVSGMRGITDDEGNPVPYSPEMAKDVLGATENSDVRDWLISEAHNYGQFYTDSVEKDAKNSSTGSSGKAAGAGRSGKKQGSKV